MVALEALAELGLETLAEVSLWSGNGPPCSPIQSGPGFT